MTDGLNAVWSNDRAAPTDTNPKNLDLAPPQSVTATRLDQLVYSPNCYIQIFQSQLFNRSEDRTPNRSLEVKVQRATKFAIELYKIVCLSYSLLSITRKPLTQDKQGQSSYQSNSKALAQSISTIFKHLYNNSKSYIILHKDF